MVHELFRVMVAATATLGLTGTVLVTCEKPSGGTPRVTKAIIIVTVLLAIAAPVTFGMWALLP